MSATLERIANSYSTQTREPSNPKWQRIKTYEAPFLEDKMREGTITDPKRYGTAFGEWKKFAYLASEADAPIAMTSREVDEVWHQFILFTREYRDFCSEHLGSYLDHKPATREEPVDELAKERFAKAYQESFGEFNEIWDQEANCSRCASCATRCGGGCSG